MFKLLGKLTGEAVKFIVVGKVINSKKGADFLSSDEVKSIISPKNKGLLFNGLDGRISLKDSYQGALLVAPPSQGKTTKYIIPNILDKARSNCSLVVHDPKGECFEQTSGYMEQNGFDVVLYDVRDVARSHCFNPFSEARNLVELEQIAETFIWAGNSGDKDPYWNNGATNILNVLIKCLSFGKEKYFHPPNAHRLLQNFGSMGEGLSKWISRNCWDPKDPDDRSVLNQWKGALTGNDEAIQSYVGVALNALRAFSNKDLVKFFSKSDYKMSDLRKKKTVIYFVTPPEYQQYYSFVTSLFFRCVFNECMRREHLSNKSLDVHILYDEFGNSYVPDFPSVANTIRGYRVSLTLVLQSINQLTARYGQANADVILGAISNKLCLAGADAKTTSYFSSQIGIVRERQLSNLQLNNMSTHDYNLLNSSDVRTIREDEVLIISKNRQPIKTQIVPYYAVKKFVKQSSFPPAWIDRRDKPMPEYVEL